MRIPPSRPGYVLLISVLAVGAIVTLMVAVLLLLSATIARSTISLEQSARAMTYANTCAERMLLDLFRDPNATSNGTVTFAFGSCTTSPVAGVGNTDRAICVEGLSGTVRRRLEISVSRLLPSVRVRSWREVTQFSLCPS